MTGRVGPYEISAEPIRGLGVEFVEAKSATGVGALLQLVHLRAPAADEADARHAYEKALASETTKLLVEEPELTIHAHGGADGPDGTRILFWAVDPAEGAYAAAPGAVEDALGVLEIGRDLADRLGRRHRLGRTDPLLSEHAVMLGPTHARLVGVPVELSTQWVVGPGVLDRRAPEEISSDTLTPMGDIWRLGWALKSLARGMDDLPAAFVECVERLSADDASIRPGSASDALVALDAAVDVLRAKNESPTDETAIPSVAEATTQEDLPAPSLSPLSEDDVPTGESHAFELSVSTVDAPLPELSEAEDFVDADPDPSEVRTRQEAFAMPTGDLERLRPGTDERDAAAAAAWSQPDLPIGASPWSEVVSARGTERRAHSSFTGFSEDIPGPQTLESIDAIGPRPSVIPPPASTSALLDKDDPELQAALTGFNGRKVVMGIVAILLILGFFLMVSRPRPDPIAALPSVVANEFSSLTIEARPPNAQIISAADGLILGTAPIDFVLAPNSGAEVIVTAPGFDPQRIVLPERGRIEVKLTPIPDAARCAVQIVAPSGTDLVGIGQDIGRGPDYEVRGAAVIRADGAMRGARIVRCPSLGGAAIYPLTLDRPWPPAMLTITEPDGVDVAVDRGSVKPVPITVPAKGSFANVRLADGRGGVVERWVPTRTDVELQLPAPRPGLVAAHVTPEAVAATAQDHETVEPPPRRVPTAQSLLQAGSRLLLAGRVERARSTLTECIEQHPDSADCHRVLATLYQQTRATSQARLHFRRYLELRPDAPDATTIRRMIDTAEP